jgi:hypothetical protein
MAAQELLLVSAVTGLLVVGAAAGIARLRHREGIPYPAGRAVPALAGGATGTDGRSDAPALAAVVLVLVLVFVFVGVAAVVDALTMMYVSLALMVVGFFALGVYHMARVRGLPTAHAVGLSTWLFGVVLVGVVALKLLLA